jgi:hypothetical protein
MDLVASLKRAIKSNALLWTNVSALRSRQPLSNVTQVRRNWLFSKVVTRTLVSYDRLLNTYDLARSIERDRIPGAYVECGVWRGGVAGLLAMLARGEAAGRETHLFDSFEGLPNPTQEDGERGREIQTDTMNGALEPVGWYVATRPDVESFLFDTLALDRKKVVLHQGWFQQTLPELRDGIRRISLLRIDADWYESVKVCLDHLYERVVPGGFVILDDYGTYPGCRQAVHEFMDARGIAVELHRIDENGVWFQKPRANPEGQNASR